MNNNNSKLTYISPAPVTRASLSLTRARAHTHTLTSLPLPYPCTLTCGTYSAANKSQEESLSSLAPPIVRQEQCVPHPLPLFSRFMIALAQETHYTHIVAVHYINQLNYGNLFPIANVFENFNSDIQRDSDLVSLHSMAAQLAESFTVRGGRSSACLTARIFSAFER